MVFSIKDDIMDYHNLSDVNIIRKISNMDKFDLCRGKNDNINYKDKKETESIKYEYTENTPIKMLSRLGGGDLSYLYIKEDKETKSDKIVFPRGTGNYSSINNLKNLSRPFVFNIYVDKTICLYSSIMYLKMEENYDIDFISWYISRSKYIRYIFIKYNTFDELTRKIFKFIPKITNGEKTDEFIYHVLKLSKEEIEIIEKTIK
jgi:hypothetical protein